MYPHVKRCYNWLILEVLIQCPFVNVTRSYNEALNASIVYKDSPKAQYAPCQSWEGNRALEGAVGDIMATTPIGFYLTYQSPSGEEGGLSSSLSSSHSSDGASSTSHGPSPSHGAPHKSHRRLTSSNPSAGNDHVSSAAVPSPADSHSGSPTHSPDPHAPGNQSPHATADNSTDTPSFVTDAINGVPVVVPEYTSGAPLALGLLLFDLFGNPLNMSEANSAGTVLVYSMDPHGSEQMTLTVRMIMI